MKTLQGVTFESNSKANMQFTKLVKLESYKPHTKVITKVKGLKAFMAMIPNRKAKATRVNPIKPLERYDNPIYR